jgi:hypothetical protein
MSASSSSNSPTDGRANADEAQVTCRALAPADADPNLNFDAFAHPVTNHPLLPLLVAFASWAVPALAIHAILADLAVAMTQLPGTPLPEHQPPTRASPRLPTALPRALTSRRIAAHSQDGDRAAAGRRRARGGREQRAARRGREHGCVRHHALRIGAARLIIIITVVPPVPQTSRR